MIRPRNTIPLLLTTLSLLVCPESRAQIPAEDGRAIVVVRSDPVGASIQVEGLDDHGFTPDTLTLDPSETVLRVSLEKYQPLTHSLNLAAGSVVSLDFILLQTPPELPTPEEIGLSHQTIVPRRDPMEALAVRRQYMSLVQTLVVLPLSQGLIAKVAFDDDSSFPADEFFYSGLVLVTASTLVGEYLFKKRQRTIAQVNWAADAANESAVVHNREVDQALAIWHQRAVEEWQIATEGRGLVETKVLWPGQAEGQ